MTLRGAFSAIERSAEKVGLGFLFQALRSAFGRRKAPIARIPNLLGDRDVEWSWVAARIPEGPGKAIDFGTGESMLALIAARRGFEVTAIDLLPVSWAYEHPNLKFANGDILKMPLESASFDLIINCSSVEHVGLAGRYGIEHQESDGDLRAMRKMRELLKPGGTMIMTLPVGRDAVFPPYARVYGKTRLPLLIEGFHVHEEEYWTKAGTDNRWKPSSRDEALSFIPDAASSDPAQVIYALGCYLLKIG